MNLFVGTNNGVYLSTNNGTSWAAVNNGLSNLEVHALAVNGTNLFAGTNGGGVFFSTNYGTSWTEVNNNLTATSIQSLAVSETNLFAGTDAHGVWRLPIIVRNDH
jgi:ligand-binding sensor domain-containing protein